MLSNQRRSLPANIDVVPSRWRAGPVSASVSCVRWFLSAPCVLSSERRTWPTSWNEGGLARQLGPGRRQASRSEQYSSCRATPAPLPRRSSTMVFAAILTRVYILSALVPRLCVKGGRGRLTCNNDDCGVVNRPDRSAGHVPALSRLHHAALYLRFGILNHSCVVVGIGVGAVQVSPSTQRSTVAARQFSSNTWCPQCSGPVPLLVQPRVCTVKMPPQPAHEAHGQAHIE